MEADSLWRILNPDPTGFTNMYMQSFRVLSVLPRLLLGAPRTEEEQLCHALRYIGPPLAIAQPGETLPPVGFPRLMLDPTTWQDDVTTLLKRARLVVLRCGVDRDFDDGYWPTDHSEVVPGGLGWEIACAVNQVRPERLILLLPFDGVGYEDFCYKTKNIFPKELPQWIESHPQLGTIRSVVWFDENWNSRLAPVTWMDTGWRWDTLHPLSKALDDIFHAILRTQLTVTDRITVLVKRAVATVVDYTLVVTAFSLFIFGMFLFNRVPLFLSVILLAGTIILYEAILESSPLMSTFGKCLFGLTVTDEISDRLDFKKAIRRSFVKLTLLPFSWANTLTGSGLALHDVLTKTKVTAHVIREREPSRRPFLITAVLLWGSSILFGLSLLSNPVLNLPYGARILPGPLFFPSGVPAVALNATFVDGLVIIPAKANGQQLSLLLGTRAGVTIIDKQTAQSLGLRPLPGNAAGTNNQRALDLRSGTTLELGSAKLLVSSIIVSDLTVVSAVCRAKIDGVIGYDLLRNSIIVIDYPGAKVILEKPEEAVRPSTKNSVPLALKDGWASVSAVIRVGSCENASANYLINTGAKEAVLFPGCDGQVGKREKLQSRESVFSASQFASVQVGSVVVNDLQPGCCIRTPLPPQIGAGFLKRFVVTIDYPHSLMFLDGP
jgi:uncharacterized RDD family membrane protein YckC